MSNHDVDVSSPEEAAAVLRPTDRMAIPLGPGQPTTFLHALASRDDWVDLQIFGALLVDLYEVLLRPGVHYTSGFYGPAERMLLDAGADIQFVPSDFRRFEPILERLCPRVMCTVATPPDADGNMSLSLHAGASVAELHRAGADPDRLLVVEMNDRFPRTRGTDEHPHRLHVSEADVLLVGDRDPLNLAEDQPTDVDRAIAEYAAGFVTDGCTLQTGIGGIPSMVGSILAERDGGDYGVHSEMFTTGLMRLHQAGKVTNRRKGIYEGFSVATFAAGTPELYEFLDGTDEVRFLPVDAVNSPEIIARNRDMVCINGAVAVDLAGQVMADTVHGRQYSGIGGHEDFNAPSGIDAADRSLVCLPSTLEADGVRMPRIVEMFQPPGIVTTPRHQLDVVVTEYGVADVRGLTVRQRAEAIAAVAHPEHRPALLEAAASRR